MKLISGLLLVVFGVIIFIWGDKALNVKDGAILKSVTMPKVQIAFVKWAIAIFSLLFGLSLIMDFFKQ